MSITQTRGTKMKKRTNGCPYQLEYGAPALPENGDLSGTDRANLSTLSLLGELYECGYDVIHCGVQITINERGLFVGGNVEGCRAFHCKEHTVASPVGYIEKENSLNLFKDSFSPFSRAMGDVSIGKFFAKLAELSVLLLRIKDIVSIRFLPLLYSLRYLNFPKHYGRAEEECYPYLAQYITFIFTYFSQIAKMAEGFDYGLEQTVEKSFVFDEGKSEGKIPSLDVDLTIDVLLESKKEDGNLVRVSHSALRRAPTCCLRKKLLILDVNGLLADLVSPAPKGHKADMKIGKLAVFKRPYCSDFLKFCFERFDVGIWSSRSKKILERVVEYLMGNMKHKLLFCWDLSHCTGTRFRTLENRHKILVFKELKKLWDKEHDPSLPWEKGDYNESNTLLLDDSPYKALLNPPHSAIFPYSYKFLDRKDNSLGFGGDIRVFLEELAAAENLPKYLEEHPHPIGQNAITERNASWNFYLRAIRSIPR